MRIKIGDTEHDIDGKEVVVIQTAREFSENGEDPEYSFAVVIDPGSEPVCRECLSDHPPEDDCESDDDDDIDQ